MTYKIKKSKGDKVVNRFVALEPLPKDVEPEFDLYNIKKKEAYDYPVDKPNPLTKTGKEALKNFQAQYGKDKGKRYFYAYMNKYPERTEDWHLE